LLLCFCPLNSIFTVLFVCPLNSFPAPRLAVHQNLAFFSCSVKEISTIRRRSNTKQSKAKQNNRYAVDCQSKNLAVAAVQEIASLFPEKLFPEQN
jgi:hypothetical protein